MKLNISLNLTLSFLFFFSIISCGVQKNKKTTSPIVVYPAPPEKAKIQYLTSISSSVDVTKKQSAFEKSVVGEKEKLPIYKPYGIFLRNGKLYVCDISIGGLEIINLETKKFDYFIPKGQHQLGVPVSCFVDTNNFLYIADVNQQKIAVFDGDGNFKTSFGKNENKKPTDVFIKGKNIFVADSDGNRINVYNKNTYKFESYFPKLEVGDPGFLYKPTNIFISDTKIFVSDLGNGSIKIFDLKGNYLQTVSKYGKNIGELVRPKGIAADKEGNIFIADASFENVQIFNKDGALLMFFGGHFNKEKQGDMWLPTKVIIDYDNLQYFKKYVDPKYNLKYLILVANQFGPEKINVYGRIEEAKATTPIK